MWLYFNSKGQMTQSLEHGPIPNVGTTNFSIFAVFENINIYTNDDYVASLTLIKPDLYTTILSPLVMENKNEIFVLDPNYGENVSNVLPFQNGKEYFGFELDFANLTENQEVVSMFDMPGEWRATITIQNIKKNVFVQGTFNFHVGGVAQDEENIKDNIYDTSIERIIQELATYQQKYSMHNVRFYPTKEEAENDLNNLQYFQFVVYLNDKKDAVNAWVDISDNKKYFREVPVPNNSIWLIATYDIIKNLKANNQLVPGRFYVIEDYIATTDALQSDVRSNNKGFPIIVQAVSENSFDENARSLNGYILKYSFDNDATRFDWADEFGKGVIYYLKDKNNNEAPFDFKNIQVNVTITHTNGGSSSYWGYLFSSENLNLDVSETLKVHDNKISSFVDTGSTYTIPKIIFSCVQDSDFDVCNNVVKECNRLFVKNPFMCSFEYCIDCYVSYTNGNGVDTYIRNFAFKDIPDGMELDLDKPVFDDLPQHGQNSFVFQDSEDRPTFVFFDNQNCLNGYYYKNDELGWQPFDVLESISEDTKTKNILGNVFIQGNLTIEGKTIEQETESLRVKDNMIVVNADGAILQKLAGLGIKTNTTKVYGIVYDPTSDSVKLGLGNINTSTKDFSFDSEEGEPIAIRDDNSKISDKHVLIWDATKHKLIDSGKKVDDFLDANNVTTGFSPNATVRTNNTGYLVIRKPVDSNNPVNKLYMDQNTSVVTIRTWSD